MHTSQTEDLAYKEPPTPVSLWQATLYWLRLGLLSFGGPAGQISMMHQDLVENRRWISERRYLHALNYTMVLPGPEAQQLATYIGWLLHGIKGGLIAGLLFILPSFFLLAALTWTYLAFGDVPLVQGLLYGIKPAVTAIVLFAAWRIGSRALRNWALRIIAALAFVAIFVFSVPFPLIVLAAAGIGYIGSRLTPQFFQLGGGHQGDKMDYGPALIDEHTPLPEHARFSWKRMLVILFCGLTLFMLPLLILALVSDLNGTLAAMGWFFTKAALVTFGGAYAVLPYVYQGAVEQYGWLTATQMIDGLALGETTPGPLIMIVAFVGFVGGWTSALFGPDQLALAGLTAAAVVTYYTFLPSFMFILLGAPSVEATRHNIGFTAPLTGITAAVVGVILNLALFFAWHVLWPDGFEGRFEFFSALLGCAAFIALFRFKAGVIPVIAACACLGLGYSLI